jgi:hypothetical protein
MGRPSSPFQAAASAGATVGIIALAIRDGRTLGSLEEDAWYPLASAGKLVIGCAAVDAVRSGELRWDAPIRDLELDPEAGSRELYPHLWGQAELELREVVEVMVAGLDRNCAAAVARQLGGWEALQERVRALYPNVRVSGDTSDTRQNSARLESIAQVARSVALGYQESPRLWRPVVAGLVRQPYKADGVPAHHILNVQGGLDTAVIDVGLMGDIATEDPVAYAVAAKQVADPGKLLAVYETLEQVIRDLYEEHVAAPLPPGHIPLTQIGH